MEVTRDALVAASTSAAPGTAVASNGNGSAASSEAADAKAKRLNPIKRKQMEERSRDIEEDIARVEAAIAICENSLLSFTSAEETRRLNLDLESQREHLGRLMLEWEEIGQALEG